MTIARKVNDPNDHCLGKKCGLRGKEQQDMMFENDNAHMIIDDDIGLEDDSRAESERSVRPNRAIMMLPFFCK